MPCLQSASDEGGKIMGRSAKPRHPQRQKACVKPLGMRDHARTEIPGYQASQALGSDWMTEPHLYDLVAHADMVLRIATTGLECRGRAEAIMAACRSIKARSLSTGRFGVTGDDLTAIRANIGATMEYLRSVPNIAI
jgi:hypothetical protein